MKKFLTVLLTVLLAISLALALVGCGEKDGDGDDAGANSAIFTVDGATITGLTQTGKKTEDLVIPSELGGVTITTIGKEAFKDSTKIKTVTLPETLTTIGESAFYGCSGMTTINLPESLTDIGTWAFYNCSKLQSITIPSKITTIPDNAFNECRKLNNVTFPSNVTTLGTEAFYKCITFTEINIPATLTNIGTDAFASCEGNLKFTVDSANPNYSALDGNLYNKNKTTFLYYALGKTATTFVVPEGVTDIGRHAFSFEEDLQTVSVASTVKNLGYGAFTNATALKTVTFGGVSSKLEKIEHRAFFGDVSLYSIEVSPKLTYVGNYAFSYCNILGQINSYLSESGWNSLTVKTPADNASFLKSSIRIYK